MIYGEYIGPDPEWTYGCVRCQAWHRESDGPIYAEHIMWQSKHGLKRVKRTVSEAKECPICDL